MNLSFNKRKFFTLTFPVLALGLIFIFYNGTKQKNYNKILEDKEALLVIEYNENKQRRFKGDVIEGMTLRDVLRAASQAGNFKFTAVAQVVSIDNISNNSQKQWNCYLNNQKIEQDFEKIKVGPKDVILCRYE